MQEPVLLECAECKRRNYATTRTRRPNRTKLERRKFCKWCRRHTVHKETKA